MTDIQARNIALAEAIVTRMRAAGFTDAIVAGGFLRDTLLGFEPKDIDVFIGRVPRAKMDFDTPESAALAEPVDQRLEHALGTPARVQFNMAYRNMDVHRVYEMAQSEAYPYPVQVIELNRGDPVGRVAEHDFGLCQIWVGSFGLESTLAFKQDQIGNVCSLVHCESEAEHKRSLKRWARLSEKLVGYTLVDKTPYGFMGGTCPCCKQPHRRGHNVFTPAGERETQTTGFCEVCFDRITEEPADIPGSLIGGGTL